jgi:2-dehydro-3-deoxyphosphogluconate aldolase/(4S)-4-hydroxy-2-oxoglutarate aldolase
MSTSASASLTGPPAGRLAPTAQLVKTGVMAILRAPTARYVERAADVLVDAGITCIELTLTVPGALDAVARLARNLPSGVALGVGTVITAQQAVDALDVGAGFLVSPAGCPDVQSVATARGVPFYPGAWTPSEVLTAWQGGAAAVKLFPAASGGPGHLLRLRDPLPDVPLVPTGGVALDDVSGYLQAGAVAVGVGTPLLGDALTGGDPAALRERCRRLLEAVAAGRTGR